MTHTGDPFEAIDFDGDKLQARRNGDDRTTIRIIGVTGIRLRVDITDKQRDELIDYLTACRDAKA